MEQKKQISCSKCGSFKIVDVKTVMMTAGALLTIMFLPIAILFFVLIVPVILLLAGILAFASGAMLKSDERMKCNTCGFKFPKM